MVEHHFNSAESWMPSPAIYCMGAGAQPRKLRLALMGYAVFDSVHHAALATG
jgi:hypothetical protein